MYVVCDFNMPDIIPIHLVEECRHCFIIFEVVLTSRGILLPLDLALLDAICNIGIAYTNWECLPNSSSLINMFLTNLFISRRITFTWFAIT